MYPCSLLFKIGLVDSDVYGAIFFCPRPKLSELIAEVGNCPSVLSPPLQLMNASVLLALASKIGNYKFLRTFSYKEVAFLLCIYKGGRKGGRWF